MKINGDLIMSNKTNKNSYAHVLDDNYIYISHLDENFQFWKLPTWPDTVTDTMASNFASTNALGRTAPVYTFSNAGPRTVQIAIPLHRDIMDEVNIGVSNVYLGEGEDYVDNLLKALQAIAVPKYNLQNKAIEPPLVAIRLSNEIFIKGVLTSGIGITYSKPILSNGKYAKVDLSITIAEVDPYDATSVFKNGGFRGVVQSLKKNMGLEE
jgi:hypothetical protein